MKYSKKMRESREVRDAPCVYLVIVCSVLSVSYKIRIQFEVSAVENNPHPQSTCVVRALFPSTVQTKEGVIIVIITFISCYQKGHKSLPQK